MSILRGAFDIAVILAVVAVLLGLYHRSVIQIITDLWAPLRTALNDGCEWITDKGQQLQVSLSSTLDSLGIGGEAWKASYLVGPVVATGFFVMFALVDLEMIGLTLNALVPSWARLAEGVDIGVLVKWAVLLSAIFSVWMVEELWGRAFLVPVHQFDRWERVLHGWLSLIGGLLAVAVIVSQGLFRAESLSTATPRAATLVTDEGYGQSIGMLGLDAESPLASLASTSAASEATQESRERALTLLMVAWPISLLFNGAVAFKTGVLQLLKLVPVVGLALLRMLAWMTAVVLPLLRTALSIIFALLIGVLVFVQKVGITIARPAVTLLRQISQSASKKNDMESRIYFSLTSWANDFEIPDEPIGNRFAIDGPKAGSTPIAGEVSEGAESAFEDGTRTEDLTQPDEAVDEATTADEPAGIEGTESAFEDGTRTENLTQPDEAVDEATTADPFREMFDAAKDENWDPFGRQKDPTEAEGKGTPA